MAVNSVEAAFKAQMRALAHKGGAVTKRRHGYDPRYYRDIGRRGGQASVAARKARMAADLNALKPGEVPIIEPPATLTDAPITEPIDTAPDTHAGARSPMTITEVLADCERFGRLRPEVSERQRILDAIAQEHLARVIAGIRDAPEPEPWDPWELT
jgi:general stress protein YciG